MIYDYRCNKCQNIFEVVCRLSEYEDSKPCPECKENDSERYHTGMAPVIDPKRLGRLKPSNEFQNLLQRMSTNAVGGEHMKGKV